MSKEAFTPAIGFLLVKQDDAETEINGIIIPEAHTEKPTRGTIVAVSRGYFQHGVFTETTYEVGDRVVYARFGGIDLELDGENFKVLKFGDILGVVTEGDDGEG